MPHPAQEFPKQAKQQHAVYKVQYTLQYTLDCTLLMVAHGLALNDRVHPHWHALNQYSTRQGIQFPQ